MFKTTKLAAGLLVACGGALMSAGAYAQSQQLDRVEVTGSLLRRIDAETALPIVTLKADELAKAGVSNAEQAVQFIAANQSATVTANSVGSSNGGAAFADLRGLGAQRTLVLVNGKRLVNNPYTATAVDLNALPMVAIERIEVLSDGASSVYGSDAISGVINFITRKEYTGIGVSASIDEPQASGGGRIYSGSIGGGIGSLSEQGWNVYGGISYRRQNELASVDRDFAKSAVIADRGVFKASPTTFPANYSQGSTVSANPTAPGCAPPLSLNLPDVFGPELCGFDYVPFIKIIPKQSQVSGILKGSFAINDKHTISAEYLRATNEVDTVISPTPLGGLSMSPASPFYPGNGSTPANPALDTTQPISIGWRATDAGGRASRFENTTDRISASLDGQLWNWDYKANLFQSKADVSNTFTGGYLNNAKIRAGLNGTDGAPFINPFGPQTAEAQQYIMDNRILGEIQNAEGTLRGASIQAAGEVMQLPAGAMQLAVGAEYLHDQNEYKNNFDLIRQAASSGLAGAEDIEGKRNIRALMAELNVPVLKNLDVSLALRWDDYSDFGSTTNPKASIRYQPIEMLVLRGSYNEGFRAPSLQEVYAPNSLTFTGSRYNDPVLCPGGTPDVAAGGIASRDCNIQFQQQQGGNRDLQPETSKAWTLGFIVQPLDTVSLGIDYWQYKIEDTIGVTGENQIFDRPNDYAAAFVRCSQATASERDLIDACQIPGGDPLAYIKNTNLNLGNYRTQGFDVSVQWNGKPMDDFGRFSAGIRSTYITKFEYQLEPNAVYNDNLGNYFNGAPVQRYRHVINFGWQLGSWGAQVFNRYSRGYTDANEDAGIDPAFFNRVSNYSVWDASVTWSGIKGLQLTAGIKNVFDEDPPFSNQGDAFQVGYDQRYANPIGRAFLLRAAYQF